MNGWIKVEEGKPVSAVVMPEGRNPPGEGWHQVDHSVARRIMDGTIRMSNLRWDGCLVMNSDKPLLFSGEFIDGIRVVGDTVRLDLKNDVVVVSDHHRALSDGHDI